MLLQCCHSKSCYLERSNVATLATLKEVPAEVNLATLNEVNVATQRAEMNVATLKQFEQAVCNIN